MLILRFIKWQLTIKKQTNKQTNKQTTKQPNKQSTHPFKPEKLIDGFISGLFICLFVCLGVGGWVGVFTNPSWIWAWMMKECMLSAVFIIIICSSRAKIDISYLSYTCTCRRWDTFPAEGRSAGNVQSPTDRKFNLLRSSQADMKQALLTQHLPCALTFLEKYSQANGCGEEGWIHGKEVCMNASLVLLCLCLHCCSYS